MNSGFGFLSIPLLPPPCCPLQILRIPFPIKAHVRFPSKKCRKYLIFPVQDSCTKDSFLSKFLRLLLIACVKGSILTPAAVATFIFPLTLKVPA